MNGVCRYPHGLTFCYIRHFCPATNDACDPPVYGSRDFSYRSGWWDEVPWNAFKATPAWERPVMKCEFISWRDGMSIGEGGIGPWFRHPRYGQPKGLLKYSFRDGSHWRGMEVEEMITMPSGERIHLTLQMRISHSPPTHSPNYDGLSMPQLFPEHVQITTTNSASAARQR